MVPNPRAVDRSWICCPQIKAVTVVDRNSVGVIAIKAKNNIVKIGINK